MIFFGQDAPNKVLVWLDQNTKDHVTQSRYGTSRKATNSLWSWKAKLDAGVLLKITRVCMNHTTGQFHDSVQSC